MSASDGRVVSNFIVQALRNKPITIYGNGNQTRSFCYVEDLIEGLVALMDTPAAVIGPVNLGNPNEFTIAQLAELVIELTGSHTQLSYHPLPSDDPRQRCPDITLAHDTLAWTPHIPLREGLARTIRYFDTLLTHGDDARGNHPGA